MRRPRCYIAGPMRGLPEYNYPTFMEADEKLTKAGWVTFNPAVMDMEEDPEDNYQAHSIEEQKLHDTAESARRFARRDLAVITDELRAERGDAIVILPGWENSIGAKAETDVGIWVFLPILTVEEAIDREGT